MVKFSRKLIGLSKISVGLVIPKKIRQQHNLHKDDYVIVEITKIENTSNAVVTPEPEPKRESIEL